MNFKIYNTDVKKKESELTLSIVKIIKLFYTHSLLKN